MGGTFLKANVLSGAKTKILKCPIAGREKNLSKENKNTDK